MKKTIAKIMAAAMVLSTVVAPNAQAAASRATFNFPIRYDAFKSLYLYDSDDKAVDVTEENFDVR